MPQNLILTQAGIQKLKTELENLTKVRRKEIAQKIKEAKEQGDLSENAEYSAAKEEQGLIEARIAELEHSIKTADVVDSNEQTGGKVTLGSTVVVATKIGKLAYEIVGTNEADPLNKKISNESPLGQALMGKKIGDTIDYSTPGGQVTATIEKVQ